MTLFQRQLSKDKIWRKVQNGTLLEEKVAADFSLKDIPLQLLERWRKRQHLRSAVLAQGIEKYASRGEFNEPENVQKLLNLLGYRSGSDYRTQSAELTLQRGYGNCLEGALVAAYLLESRGYMPELLTLNFESISHALCIMEDETGFRALHKRRRIIPEKLKIYSSLENLANDFIRQYQREDYRTVKWGISDLVDLSLDWRYGWKSRGGDVEKLERRLDEITCWTHI